MRLEQIGAYGYGAQISRAQRKDQESDVETRRSPRLSRKDSYVPSNGDVFKADSVKEVQKRVDSKFYQSDAVNEDLADVFTKLFDR